MVVPFLGATAALAAAGTGLIMAGAAAGEPVPTTNEPDDDDYYVVAPAVCEKARPCKCDRALGGRPLTPALPELSPRPCKEGRLQGASE